MGNADTKLHFRKAVVQLTTKTQPIDAGDESFWEQFWGEHTTNAGDVFALIPAAEIRSLREEAPSNLATLCYKAVEKLVRAGDTGCSTSQDQQVVLNCVRILTRVLPYIFEDPDWRGFFWSSLPAGGEEEEGGEGEPLPLAHSLIQALTCSSVLTSQSLPTRSLDQTSMRTCKVSTAASTSGRRGWGLHTPHRTSPLMMPTAPNYSSWSLHASATPYTSPPQTPQRLGTAGLLRLPVPTTAMPCHCSPPC